MTRNAIAEKLVVHMNKPPADAMDLVYGLVKIRKMLDHERKKKVYWTLTFYCDWVLHTELRGDGARKILTMLDNSLAHFNPAKPKSFDLDGIIQKILSFQLFREELFYFLRSSDLPTVWAEDQSAWNNAVVLYGEEVRDTPLVMTDRDYNLKYLREIVITACEPAEDIVKANPEQKHFGFRWQFTLKDGRTFPMGYTSNLPEPPPDWPMQGTRC